MTNGEASKEANGGEVSGDEQARRWRGAVAVLGLGAMGARMAARLVNAGIEVRVWNRDAARAEGLVEAGATLAPSPQEAARGAAMVLSMVTDEAASRRVWLGPQGALAGMAPGAVAIESSTVRPDHQRALAGAAAEVGARFLDAPVVGTRPHAEAGALIFLVGGDGETLVEVAPLLALMGQSVRHVGAVGVGAALKLAVNAMFGLQVAALGELAGALEREGMAREQALTALLATPVISPALAGIGALLQAGRYDPMFPVALVRKDLDYAAQRAEAVGGRAPLTRAAAALYKEACEAGHGDDNIHGVARLFMP